VQGGAALPLAERVGLTASYRIMGFSLGDRLGAQLDDVAQRSLAPILGIDSRVLIQPRRGYAARVPNHLLSPDEVLARYSAGPKSGVFTDGSCEGNPGPGRLGRRVGRGRRRSARERSGRDPPPPTTAWSSPR
jgi:hypothetical protein